MSKRANVITVANQKGGVGKTTLSVNLAAGFARLGYDTTLFDLDSQCNASTTLGVRPEQLVDNNLPTVADAFLARRAATNLLMRIKKDFRGELRLVCGHRSLDQVKSTLDSDIKKMSFQQDVSPYEEDDMRKEHRHRFKESMESILSTNDVIIIDTPPRLGFELTAALIASDYLIIPMTAAAYDQDGAVRLVDNMVKVHKRENPRISLLGVVLNEFSPRTTLHRQVKENLEKMFPDGHLCNTVIHDSVRVKELSYAALTIYEHAEDQPISKQFEDLVLELANRMKLTNHLQETPKKVEPLATPEVKVPEPLMENLAEVVNE